ncbi:hypothetical protein EVAR_87443_1 [Eumeta japonica]|uniref:Uncharacterized protein n=1 Tax=Eumeta variegata TaxID=151549 RepID=A0A4C1XGK1_EUMVA|nr:hypothetical protein EVAR_87443_1 [Eumeta japonica]
MLSKAADLIKLAQQTNSVNEERPSFGGRYRRRFRHASAPAHATHETTDFLDSTRCKPISRSPCTPELPSYNFLSFKIKNNFKGKQLSSSEDVLIALEKEVKELTVIGACQDTITVSSYHPVPLYLSKELFRLTGPTHFNGQSLLLPIAAPNFQVRDPNELLKLFGIKRILASRHHTQTCGAIECSQVTPKEYLRSFVDENQQTWGLLSYRGTAMSSYNYSVHSATGRSPLELLFEYKPHVPSSIDELKPTAYNNYERALDHKL